MCGKCSWQAAAGVALALFAAIAPAGPPGPKIAAELDAHRLIGKAHYENDKYAEAAAAFRRCIELASDSAVDRFNLGLVLMRAQEYEEALRVLAEAQALDPGLLAAYYIRGIIYKRQSEFTEAVEALQHVITHDPQCRGAHYNLGVCYKFLKGYEEAVAAFKKGEELSPTDPSTQYQLITLYRRLGQVDNAERHKEIYDRVKETVDESAKTAEALERSKYTYIIEAPRLTGGVEPRPAVRTTFEEVTVESGLPKPGEAAGPKGREAVPGNMLSAKMVRDRYVPSVGGAIALADYDDDGDLDIYVVNCSADTPASANRLYRNKGNGRYVDVTAAAGVGDPGLGVDAVFGDYDNDGHNDLYVVNCGANVLYRNRGDGCFEDVSEAARVNEPQFGRKALLMDYDHDNDLDFFVANDVDFAALQRPLGNRIRVPEDYSGQSNTLLRNNGNGTFSDQTDEAGLLTAFTQTRDAVFADFDGDHDSDLFVVNADAPATFFANARMGNFITRDAFSPPIPAGAVAIAEGDFTRDGHGDLLVAVAKALHLYTNDGQARFTGQPIALPDPVGQAGVAGIGVFDYNNDGWNDLLLIAGDARLFLLAGAGVNAFRNVTAAVGLGTSFGRIADLAVGDLDGDGNQDIVLQTRDRGPMILRNDSRERHNWLDVRLVGKKVNRSGYGATVEIASGGHYQKQTYRDGPVHFGLGDLTGVDVVRVTWPNGVAQNVIRPAINQTLTIEEYVKVSASCGFLYAYNGQGFELINEILGIGPLGVPMAPGVYYPLDCTELTKIEGHQLVVQDGRYELRLTEELREITFADQITLRVVDHPAGLEIIPNEMFTTPPFPEDKFFAVADQRGPVSAVDDRGQDVLALVLKRDGRFPTFPRVAQYPGLAEPHSLTLEFGDLSGAERIMLYLDSWIYWAESSVGMAIAQDPRYELKPLTLEVRSEAGDWRTAVEWIGLPTSKGLVVPVDLTGRFLCDDYQVRLSTNLCVYFDRIFISKHDQAGRCRQTELPVAQADLHYRGFSRMRRGEFGYERFDYAEVSPTGSWDPPEGMFTRYGDVTPLLAEPDDRYVIFGPGDELTLRFDAGGLPELPARWTRDFIFYANGWVKDGDLNTKFSETVEPLPFHGMSGYPYSADQHYPRTPELVEYRRRYNTRRAGSTVGSLVQPAGAAR